MARVRRSQAGDQTRAPRIPFPAISAGIPTASHGLGVRLDPSPPADAVLNAQWQGERVVLVRRDAQGALSLQHVPAEHSCFMRLVDVPQTRFDQMRSHPAVADVRREGEWVRVRFVSRLDLTIFVASAIKDKLPTFEAFVSPVLRHMVDNNLRVATPRVIWVDIETDSRVPFSRKEDMRVLCWCVDDGKGFTARGLLKADTDAQEREVLSAFWQAIEPYDLVAAWSGDRFDFPVLGERSIRTGLIGPGRIDASRWLWLDHLELFRRMNMGASDSGEEKQSFKLDTVARKFLGPDVGKLEFDASQTWQEWAAGGARRKRLVDYCAQDTRLMPQLEDATGYIQLLFTLADACGTFPDSRGINPSVQVEGFLQRLALARGHKFPTVPRRPYGQKSEHASEGKFKGAFVMEPKGKGIHRDVHVADFSAMYPSIIRSWNMSPETIVGMGAPGPSDDTSWSPLTKASFDTMREGILCAAVGELLRLRKEWTAKKNAEPPGTDAWKEADRRSAAYKIATNSFYGVIGAPHGRFFDRRVAEAVTQCGAWLIHQTIAAAEHAGMEVIYGDTDSLFVVGAQRADFEAFVQRCNDELYPQILRDVGCKSNYVALAYEKQFDRLILSTAKKYIGSFVHYKGKAASRDSRPEVKGLEYKRGDATRFARQLQEQVVYRLLGFQCEPSEDPRDFEALLETWRERMMTGELALSDVLISKRLSRPLAQYSRKVNKNGTASRQLPHIELAWELQAAGQDMNEGAKVDYVITDSEAKPLPVVAADKWDGTLNRGGMWRTQIAPASVRLLEAAFPDHDWQRWLLEGLVTRSRVRKAASDGKETQRSVSTGAEPGIARRRRSSSRAELSTDRASDAGEQPELGAGAPDAQGPEGTLGASSSAGEIPRRRRRSECPPAHC